MHIVQSAVLLLLLFLVPHCEIYNLNRSLSIDITQSNAVKWKYRKYLIYIENIKNIENISDIFENIANIFHPCA